MTHRTDETSSQMYARIGGALYLIIIVAGLFGQAFVREQLTVSGDATATANNIATSQLLWRISIAGELVMLMCAVPLVLIFYVLLRPVSRNLALLAAFFNLVSIAVEVVNKSYLFSVLFLLGGADYLNVFEPRQLHALAYLSLRSHTYGFATSLVFFGCVCLILGYLIFRSGYFPKVLGVLMQVAGLCYLANSFALVLTPAFADLIFPAILIPAFIGEASLCLWLLLKGVNVPRWNEQASAWQVSGA